MTDRPPRGSCARCSAPLVTIAFRQGPSTMTMASCARCHRRTWRRDDEAVDLDRVLWTLAQARSRSRLAR